MIRRLVVLVALVIPMATFGQGVLHVKDGSDIPALDTQVMLFVRGMILRGKVTQRYMPENTTPMSSAVPVNEAGTNIATSEKHHMHLTVDLDSGFSLRKIESSYHQITTSAVNGSHYMITLGDVPADRDVELVWQP